MDQLDETVSSEGGSRFQRNIGSRNVGRMVPDGVQLEE